MAGSLIENLPSTEYIVADKGYDSEMIRDAVRRKGATPVIPRRKNSKISNKDID